MAVDLSSQRLWAGEYEIREKVAQGGMATVYSAYARSLDTTVAVKVLSPRLASDPSFLDRFHAEATSIAGLHHPNIIEVHHFGVEDGSPYITMRYVSGGTLKERLQDVGGLMELRSAARLIAQVASALQYAHERGLIHLDVKPANVLLGSADWPLLSDFGITRIAGDARQDGHRVAGTPAYMSPEQWQGLDVDGRSDEYSLALTLYEMITGRRPFSGETSADLKAQHLTAVPPRPRDLNPGIPGPVEEVLLRAMAKDRDERFPTIGEFGTALVEAVDESRGMQLETKQAMVAVAPSLVALLFLSAFAPLLAGLADRDLRVYHDLTLEWPLLLVTAILQIALLVGVRWHLIGLATRLFDGVLGRIERLTRSTARAARDGAPSGWRRAAVGSAEGLVSIAYLFVFYQLLGQPITKTVVLAIDRRLEDWVVTGIAALVLAVAAGIVLRVYRRGGAILAVIALAVCWGFVSSLTIVDSQILDGRLSVQWLAKLGVGLAVLTAFLAVRRQVQRAVRGAIVPILNRPLAGIDRRGTAEQQAAAREPVERGLDAVVNVAYLVVGYPIVALSLRKVLDGFIPADGTVIVIVSVGIILIAAALVNRARARAGAVAAALGLLICAPTLMALPVFTEGTLGSSSLNWVPRVLIGAAVVAIFLGVRRRLQATGRQVIVPALDDGLSDIIGNNAARSEEQQAKRRVVLEGAANALVDVVYLVAAYLVVVGPIAAGLGDLTGLTWVAPIVNAVFLIVVAYVTFRFVRGLLPTLPPPVAAPSSTGG